MGSPFVCWWVIEAFIYVTICFFVKYKDMYLILFIFHNFYLIKISVINRIKNLKGYTMKLTEAKQVSNADVTEWILDGKLNEIKEYFKQHPEEIKYKLEYNQDILAFSIYAGYKDIFDWFLKNGAKPGTNRDGQTAMHQATYNNDPYYVNELVKFGMDVNKSTKKMPSALAVLINRLANGKSGMGGSISRKLKQENAKRSFEVFKALLDGGADVTTTYSAGEPIFLMCVEKDFVEYVKEMIKKDKSVLDLKKFGKRNAIDLALVNYSNKTVKLLLDLGIKPTNHDLVYSFFKNSSDTDVSFELYSLFNEEEKRQIKMEELLYIQDGEEKLIRLLELGVNIYDSFILNKRVRKIADKLLQTSRKEELEELGVKNHIEEFFPSQAKDIFLF